MPETYEIQSHPSTQSASNVVTATVTLNLAVNPGSKLLPEANGFLHVQFSLAPEEPKRKSLFETASDAEWEAFLASVAVDPSIPILSDEALDSEADTSP
jgi:hypothetical protein